jgi:hypothetical protein
LVSQFLLTPIYAYFETAARWILGLWNNPKELPKAEALNEKETI